MGSPRKSFYECIGGNNLALDNIRVLVFDLDGTLVRLPVDWSRVIQQLSEVLGKRANSVLGILNQYYNTPLYNRINEVIEAHELKSINKLEILDNSVFLLRKLSNRYRISIITMQSKRVAREVIYRMGVSDIVNTILAREDARNRIEQLSYLLKILDVPNQKVLFIGDKVLDAIAAYVNKVRSVIVLRGRVNRLFTETDDVLEDLEVLNPIIINNLWDLLKYIK